MTVGASDDAAAADREYSSGRRMDALRVVLRKGSISDKSAGSTNE